MSRQPCNAVSKPIKPFLSERQLLEKIADKLDVIIRLLQEREKPYVPPDCEHL